VPRYLVLFPKIYDAFSPVISFLLTRGRVYLAWEEVPKQGARMLKNKNCK